MVFLDIFEVVVRADLHFSTSSFVADDDAFRMELESGDSPHLVYGTLDSLLQSTRLVVSVYHD